ncbi:MAG: tetratricopeptide repeat protein [Nitrospiraceae bacterium]
MDRRTIVQTVVMSALAAVTLAGCAEDQRWLMAMERGNAALRSGDYTHAEEQYIVARKEAETIDPGGKRLAETLGQLGEVNRDLGRFAEAEKVFQQALAIREKVYGPDHAETAASLTDLGELYRMQGLFTQSEALHQRAREIREKVFGADSSKVAESLNNIAVVYQEQRRYADAEPILQRALTILEKRSGPSIAFPRSLATTWPRCIRRRGNIPGRCRSISDP